MDRQVVSLVLGRLGLALVTILIVSFVVFAATAMLPGDVAQILLGQAATDEAVAGLRTAMHLDDPAILRFLRWLAGLVQGDLGTSYANNMPVAELIGAGSPTRSSSRRSPPWWRCRWRSSSASPPRCTAAGSTTGW